MTTYADRLYQMGGIPVDLPKVGLGQVLFVKPSSGSDSNDGLTPGNALKTLARALALSTANKGDIVYLIAESNTASSTTDYQSTALDWNKDGVHLIGVNCGVALGSRSRIAQLSTVKTIENLLTISADNCLIANIEVFQGVADSTATAPIAVVVSGQRNLIAHCQISGNGDTGGSMDVAGARSLKVTGSENKFYDCYIGLDTVSRATQDAELEFANGGSAATRNIFENCIISSMSGDAGFCFVNATSAAAAIDRFVLFKNCTFLNAINSTATTMTAAIEHHADLTGTILLDHCTIVGATDVTAADSSKVLHLSSTGAANASNEHLNMSLAKSVDVS